MMKKLILALAVMAIAAAASTARAGVSFSIGIPAPVVSYRYAAPVYAPAPPGGLRTGSASRVCAGASGGVPGTAILSASTAHLSRACAEGEIRIWLRPLWRLLWPWLLVTLEEPG